MPASEFARREIPRFLVVNCAAAKHAVVSLDSLGVLPRTGKL